MIKSDWTNARRGNRKDLGGTATAPVTYYATSLDASFTWSSTGTKRFILYLNLKH